MLEVPFVRENVHTRLVAVKLVRGRVPSLAGEITDHLRSEIPELIMEDAAIVRGFVCYVIGTTLAAVETGHPGPIVGPTPGNFRRLSPRVADRAFRLTVECSWKALIEAADGPDQARLLNFAHRVFQQTRRPQATDPEVARPRSVTEDDLRRSLARRLLHGKPVNLLAERLGVKLASSYIVALMDAGSEDRCHEDRQGLPILVEEGHLIALLPCPTPPSRKEVAPLCMRTLRRLTGRGHLLVAAAPARSREHIAAAADEARAVLRVVRAVGLPAGVYQLDDIPLEAALMRSPDLADLLALRLAPLYSSGAPLLETLEVYLETTQDRRHAAQALHVHPNTLDYRLRRIKELTGLSPTVPRDIQTLGAAITAWRLTRGALAGVAAGT